MQLGCTHALGLRAAANILPDLPGWAYAPISGKAALRGLLRARVLTSKEAGLAEDRDTLLEKGRYDGLKLAGYNLGPAMIAEMSEADLPASDRRSVIAQSELGGGGLWLRAEPDHAPEQAEALVERILSDLAQ